MPTKSSALAERRGAFAGEEGPDALRAWQYVLCCVCAAIQCGDGTTEQMGLQKQLKIAGKKSLVSSLLMRSAAVSICAALSWTNATAMNVRRACFKCRHRVERGLTNALR
jgi:hypothetical protein